MAKADDLEHLTAAVEASVAAEVVALTDHELAERAVELDRLRSLMDAAQTATLQQVRLRGIGQVLGYRSDATWLADSTRGDRRRHAAHLGRARLLERLPLVARALADGALSTEHVEVIAKLARQRKYAAAVARDEALFTEWASEQQWPEFAQFCGAWAEVNDPVDPSEIEQRAMDDRGLSVAAGVDHTTIAEIHSPNLAWSQAMETLQPIIDRLFEIECDQVREAEGRTEGPVDVDRLPRTAAMRRHDALMIALRLAASAPDAADFGIANPQTLVLVDLETLLAEAERLYGDSSVSQNAAVLQDAAVDLAPASETHAELATESDTDETSNSEVDEGEVEHLELVLPPSETERLERMDQRVRRFRCETRNGLRITPTAAAVSAIAGTMRRVAFSAASRDLDVSSEARFFTGPLRQAILTRSPRCVGLGCDTNAWTCEVDHSIRHTDGGKTTAPNGDPRCGPCHRWKSQLEMLGLWPPAPPPRAHRTAPAAPEPTDAVVRPGSDHPARLRAWQSVHPPQRRPATDTGPEEQTPAA